MRHKRHTYATNLLNAGRTGGYPGAVGALHPQHHPDLYQCRAGADGAGGGAVVNGRNQSSAQAWESTGYEGQKTLNSGEQNACRVIFQQVRGAPDWLRPTMTIG